MSLTCPYCGADAVLSDSRVIYGTSYGLAWICGDYPRCDSFVGCHAGTSRPKGTLANPELRAARKVAHAAFDPRWQRRGGRGRSAAYRWLARQLGLSEDECHVGLMDLEMCRRVVEVVHLMEGVRP